MQTAEFAKLRQVAPTRIPTKWGAEFQVFGFDREASNGRVETALAIVLGDVTTGAPLLRIHSQCFTSEVLGSLRCDCGDQLDIAMRAIIDEGRGLVIYELQEGRGIGLMAKLQAYALQDLGLDTVEANHALGLAADCRDYSLPAAILKELGISQVRLITNNPDKTEALINAGIEVTEQLPCEVPPTPHSLAYFRTKKAKLGHALRLLRREPTDHFDDCDLRTVMGDVAANDQFEFSTIEAAIRELKA